MANDDLAQAFYDLERRRRELERQQRELDREELELIFKARKQRKPYSAIARSRSVSTQVGVGPKRLQREAARLRQRASRAKRAARDGSSREK